ncbi:MAG: hypothetical protein ACRBK7_03625 [Acidimicrobiales bacterium]
MPGGEALLRFVEAAAGSSPDDLALARTSVVETLGVDVMIDAAGVAAAFQMMNRVANATGTPLDEQLIGLTASVREELDLDYLSAASQPSGELS